MSNFPFFNLLDALNEEAENMRRSMEDPLFVNQQEFQDRGRSRRRLPPSTGDTALTRPRRSSLDDLDNWYNNCLLYTSRCV